jgi:FkbM family methyltransferase
VGYKAFVRRALHRLGYDITKFKANVPGQNPFADMERFVVDGPATTIFDVGANVGQSIERFRLHYPQAHIHSFEPSPNVYRELEAAAKTRTNVSTWNFAFGATPGRSVLQENKHSVMSSMLDLGERGWGQVEKKTDIELRTIDEFCPSQNIAQVDILKSDTQGYDLEVLRGAEQMMRDNRIGLVLCEVNFFEFYRNSAPFDAIFRHLLDRNFVLAALYPIHYGGNVAAWTDALFANKVRYKEKIG